jgi:hypothetical protein
VAFLQWAVATHGPPSEFARQGDETVYGTLCVASHRPSDELAQRDADFLRGVARRVATELEDIGISPADG